eukprot:scaffold7039_cov255-Pinguiococcus_pyrenoidosus.AAC.18
MDIERSPAAKDARTVLSTFDDMRAQTPPHIPTVLLDPKRVVLNEKEALGAAGDLEMIEKLFPKCYGKPRVEFAVADEAQGANAAETQPLRVGCVLSGGQAPGGHNVIAGLFDCIRNIHPDSALIGFLDGPHGIYSGIYIEVDEQRMNMYRNTGGFDMLGSGRHKIEKPEHFEASMKVCTDLDLDGLVVIGGDDSNTNACLLGEYFLQHGCKTVVVGAPKTIDGDLRNQFIPISFGFHTACRVYSEQVSNVMTDALSSQKYWHMIRLMGRAASNIALEVALQTGPNVCLISEEVAEREQSLSGISKAIATTICQRAQAGKDYGIVLLPEGLIEFIPEFKLLIEEINDIMAKGGVHPTEEAVMHALSFNNKAVFSYLPSDIKLQLLLDRDPHGNVQVAKIETERLLAQTVAQELELLREHGQYDGTFRPQFHSFGYEGRCAAPTPFDASYCYALGSTAAMLMYKRQCGLMAAVTDLLRAPEDWVCGGVPITMLMNMELRHGKDKPVIKKALVELDGKPFETFAELREKWALNDVYRCVGPTQFARDLDSFNIPYTTRLEFAESESAFPALPASSGKFETYLVHGRGKPILLFEDGPTKNTVMQQRTAHEMELPACLGTVGQGVSAYVGEPVQNSSARDETLSKATLPLTSETRELITLSVPELANAVFRAGKPVEGVAAAPGPCKIGVAFCGRQSPGGHNILCGLMKAVEARADGSQLLGFVGGTGGIMHRSFIQLTSQYLDKFLNMGGYQALGRTVDRLRGDAALNAVEACRELDLDGLVLVGGSRTATDAAFLAEGMEKAEVKTVVVHVPCGADGRMSNQFVPCSVGFDTMSRVTASLVGNLAVDGASARKYYYFVRVIGGEASHIAVEVALKTQPNAILVAEEVAARRLSLGDIIRQLADMVAERADAKRNFGLVVVPEGLLPAIPEVGVLIGELNELFAKQGNPPSIPASEAMKCLTSWSGALLQALPTFAQEQLLLQRQSDGNIQLQQVETEKLLATLVGEELSRRKSADAFSGKYSFVTTSIGYQARSSVPSNFDCALGISHGVAAATLVFNRLNGYMTSLSNLAAKPNQWLADAIPLVALLSVVPASKELAVVPAKLGMDSPEMKVLREWREAWVRQDAFLNPGPLQVQDVGIERPTRIAEGKRDYLLDLSLVRDALSRVHKALRPGVDQGVLQISSRSLMNLVEIIDTLEDREVGDVGEEVVAHFEDASQPRKRVRKTMTSFEALLRGEKSV